MRKEADVIREKNALNKLKEQFKDVEVKRFVKLVTTFSDDFCLYILMENLQGLKQGTLDTEVWNVCRSFGMPTHLQAKYTFY